MKYFRERLLFVLILAISSMLFLGWQNVRAQDSREPLVRAVLFFSPTCGHCQKVVTEVLPPIVQQYGNSLFILMVDLTQDGGLELYRTAVEALNIPENRLGVPTLVVGDQVLVGAYEIPERFPGLIEHYLAQGGVGWPAIPGLAELAAQFEPAPTETPAVTETLSPTPLTEPTATTVPLFLFSSESSQKLLANFLNDQPANTLALVVLAGMIFTVVLMPFAMAHPWQVVFRGWFGRLIPYLAIAGLAVAAYLSYVEVMQVNAVCGPVGNCNLVQQSPYARVGGVLPVGLLGLGGYLGILVAWVISRRQPCRLAKLAAAGLMGMALFGTLFSILLTFLEPFVIGATCLWCLASAVLITSIFILSIPYFWEIRRVKSC